MNKPLLKSLGSLSKSIFLIAIYLIPVLLVDDVMALNNNAYTGLKQSSNHQSPQHQQSSSSDYRMLLKHENAKQAQINFPVNHVDFISLAFNSLPVDIAGQLKFNAFPLLNTGAYKLYRLFRVFLI